jgi:hypothetical protein
LLTKALYSKKRYLALASSSKLCPEGLRGTNTLAYHSLGSVTKEKFYKIDTKPQKEGPKERKKKIIIKIKAAST